MFPRPIAAHSACFILIVVSIAIKRICSSREKLTGLVILKRCYSLKFTQHRWNYSAASGSLTSLLPAGRSEGVMHPPAEAWVKLHAGSLWMVAHSLRCVQSLRRAVTAAAEHSGRIWSKCCYTSPVMHPLNFTVPSADPLLPKPHALLHCNCSSLLCLHWPSSLVWKRWTEFAQSCTSCNLCSK